jgi:hypothetical protein
MLQKIRFTSFLILSICAVPVWADENPPSVFVDKGVCPFECCTYQVWRVQDSTRLYSEPNGKSIVGQVGAGEKVQAMTGVVYTTPWVLEARSNAERYKVGDRLYVLTYLGEGESKVWFKGKIFEEEVQMEDEDVEGKELNFDTGNLKLILVKKGKSVWWVQIKTVDGKVGWTQETTHFNPYDMDKCS